MSELVGMLVYTLHLYSSSCSDKEISMTVNTACEIFVAIASIHYRKQCLLTYSELCFGILNEKYLHLN